MAFNYNPTPTALGAASMSPADASVEAGAGAPHYEATLQRDWQRIAANLERMAALAGRALSEGITALRERDRQLAYAVIIRDQAVDALEKTTARLCLEFLLRQQPAGAPLRFAYSAIKVNTELERVGDYAESIAHQAGKLAAREVELPLERFQEIADLVLPMLREAVRAFLAQDAALAEATIPIEDTVDQLKSRLRRDLMQMYKDNRLPFEALDPCLTITRRLERVSDQARNICLETLYSCTGQFAQHADSETFRILFVDRYHGGASLMAEALGAALGRADFQFGSAGLDPQPCPPAVAEFMREKGFELAAKPARGLTQVPELDRYHVVALLDPEAKKLFPRQSHKVLFLDWPVEDPAGMSGPPEAVRAACERTYQILDQHLRALVQAIVGKSVA
jgi:phosphate transport system protein